jgi:microcin C transport system substrate-binding protein
MVLPRLKTGLIVFIAVLPLAFATAAPAQDKQPVWRNGIATVGELKYPANFSRFDYVNPDAPKGGELRLSVAGTFDTFNPLLDKGEAASGLSMTFETLLKRSEDEIVASYGLLAESLSYPDDISSASFRIRPEAKWADGQPVTPQDVIFSFEKAKQSNPQFEFYYKHVVSVDVSGEREVTFRFDEKNNRELPAIVGEFPIVPKHWWEANGADGKPRDIARTTLELPMGSGAYRIAAFSPGSTIRYERRDDYWGKDIAINVGQHNFAAINYVYFADRDVEFQAFRAHNTDFWVENEAKRWATGYDFPAVASGQVKRETPDNAYRTSGVMQAFVPNMRRDKFKSPQLRLALNYAFDFEELNRTNFFDQYKRIDSFFYGSEMASSGLPEGRELAILNEVKAVVPPEVFTTPYKNPVGGDQARQRANLQQALQLFKQAGYELKGNRLASVKSGEQLSIEILVDSPAMVRVVSPFTLTLKKIGVDATVRMVDASQYQNRLRGFDYDMITNSWGESANPGNEQAEYWGSQAASRNGSKNYAGIADPGVDALIRKVIFAADRSDLIAAVKALDRVLLAGNYVIPQFGLRVSRIAYWDGIARPADLPQYGLGFPDSWWAKSAPK